jgi:drug/metabolite transporter (DMT)-like permease
VPSLAVAGGSQLAATLVLAGPAAIWWPDHALPATSWAAAGVLAFACTGFAFILYFRLIANAGPVNAIAVTFLIPVFAVVWGRAFLGEGTTPALIAGCATILAGTALATGLVKGRLRRPAVTG